MNKSILYYTSSALSERFAVAVRDRLEAAAQGLPIVWVTQQPFPERRRGTVLVVGPRRREVVSMYEQMLLGLRHCSSGLVFCAEHDVLYPPEHFKMDLHPRWGEWFYNRNSYRMFPSGFVFYGRPALSTFAGRRDDYIMDIQDKLDRWGRGEFDSVGLCEPGRNPVEVARGNMVDPFRTERPIIDIRHGKNLTRFSRGKTPGPLELDGWGRADKLWSELGL